MQIEQVSGGVSSSPLGALRLERNHWLQRYPLGLRAQSWQAHSTHWKVAMLAVGRSMMKGWCA